jgi:DNA-directed RNA polymerase specialized sigma subunit
MRYGPHTEETKALIRSKKLGRKRTPDERLKMRIGHRVIKLFKPEVYEALVAGSRARLLQRMQDPDFIARREAGFEKYRQKLRAQLSRKAAIDARWQQIASMRSSGMTKAAIARAMGVSHQRIGQIIKKIEGRTA